MNRAGRSQDGTTSALVIAHLPLAKKIASRWFKRAACDADRDDLVQAAAMGLLSAALRYDPTIGSFASWASPRIYGAVKDHLRAIDPMTRDARTRRNLLKATASKLRSSLRREATDDEIAAALGCSSVELEEMRLETREPTFAALDATLAGSGRTLADVLPAPEPQALDDGHVDDADLDRLFACLNERERWVMCERFVKGRKMHEIASDLHISEGRVSQIVKACLAAIRQSMLAS